MFEQAFKNIDDVLWKEAGCGSELDYAEQTSWLLFLKYLDGLEQDKSMEAQLEGKPYTFILDEPYRWESWAAPKTSDGKLDHNKALTGDDLREFVDTRPANVVANIAICLIHQANYLLDQQIRRLEKDFLKEGGLRERMTKARLQARDQQRLDERRNR